MSRDSQQKGETTKMQWSTTSEATKKFCEEKGYHIEERFVETAIGKNGQIYVTGTLGKPEEWRNLENDCDGLKYRFVTRKGKITPPLKPVRWTKEELELIEENERRIEEFDKAEQAWIEEETQ